ncbi:MAG: iron chelate uptake ABC transporter family permease subunit [Pirellulales bacterium]
MFGQSITFNVMLGTALLGATAGAIGTFAVLRRRALVGDMLSHAALPGICIAFVIMQNRNLIGLSLGALASGLLAVGAVTVITRWTRTKEDAAIGIALSVFFGAGIVLLSIVQRNTSGNQAGLDKFLFGETAGMRMSDIQLLTATALFALVIVIALYKEFQLLSFDVDFATAQGWPTLALDLVMMGTLAVVTVVGLPIVGVILMAAMIILPGAGARFWTNHLGRTLVLAALAGAAAGAIGTFLASPLPGQWFGANVAEFGSSRKAIPPGPLIVLVAAAFFLTSLLFAPRTGVVARAWAELRLRLRISREHLLRALYELSEPELPKLPRISESQLIAHRVWNRRLLDWWLSRAEAGGLVKRVDHSVQLTPSGLAAAAEVTRTHRLWELFLVSSAGIASDHVDRDADDVEHMLPPQLIDELERKLAAAGKLPRSPHVISADSVIAESVAPKN